jgi:ABC-2 type transport system permease protein
MTSAAPPIDRILDRPQIPIQSRPLFWLPAWSLAVRELVRFFRQRTRVVGALGPPVIFWVLFGAGLGGTFRPPSWAPSGMTYQEYFLPGVAVLIVLFTAIFSTISIIEDRREGFLQGVLVAPISRAALVVGKLCGGTVVAVVQVAIFLAIGPVLYLVGMAPHMGGPYSVMNIFAIGAFLTLLSFGLTALGYLIAWPLDSTQGFHAIMNVFLMPMWLLSGSFFPAPESGWLAWVMRLNPLTYGVAGLQRLLFVSSEGAAPGGLPSLATCVFVTFVFCAVCFAAAVYLTGRRHSREAR